MTDTGSTEGRSASEQIDERIAELGRLARRDVEQDARADPGGGPRRRGGVEVGQGTTRDPVWSHDGIICTGESYKSGVKLTFVKGASLDDPARLFNSSLDGNARRAIDIHEGEEVDAGAFQALIRAAVDLNTGGKADSGRAR